MYDYDIIRSIISINSVSQIRNGVSIVFQPDE